MSNKTYHKLTFVGGGCSRKLETSEFDIPKIRLYKELRNIKLGN